MASTKIGNSFRRSDAQIRDREYRNQQTKQDTLTDELGLGQRPTDTRIRRAKERARYRNHEVTVTRRTETAERAGPGTGDRRGEVV